MVGPNFGARYCGVMVTFELRAPAEGGVAFKTWGVLSAVAGDERARAARQTMARRVKQRKGLCKARGQLDRSLRPWDEQERKK